MVSTFYRAEECCCWCVVGEADDLVQQRVEPVRCDVPLIRDRGVLFLHIRGLAHGVRPRTLRHHLNPHVDPSAPLLPGQREVGQHVDHD